MAAWEAARENDGFIRVSHSLFMSPAYRDLTPKQQDLYQCCRHAAYMNREKPEPGNTRLFYFNRYYWAEKYRLYTSSGRFNDDMNSLIEHGFIRRVKSGKDSKTKNIYEFSPGWQLFGNGLTVKPEDYIGSKRQLQEVEKNL